MSRFRKSQRRPFTKRFKPAFDVMLAGGTHEMAARACNPPITPRQVYRVMAKPEVRELVRAQALNTLSLAVPRAARKLTELMDHDSGKVSMESACRVLAIDNIRPPPSDTAPLVNINVGPMPRQGVLTSRMPEAERQAVIQEWQDYGGPGYLINLQDRHGQLEHVPPETESE